MQVCNIFRTAQPAPGPGVSASLGCTVSANQKMHVKNVTNTVRAHLVLESQCRVQWPAIIYSIKDYLQMTCKQKNGWARLRHELITANYKGTSFMDFRYCRYKYRLLTLS